MKGSSTAMSLSQNHEVYAPFQADPVRVFDSPRFSSRCNKTADVVWCSIGVVTVTVIRAKANVNNPSEQVPILSGELALRRGPTLQI